MQLKSNDKLIKVIVFQKLFLKTVHLPNKVFNSVGREFHNLMSSKVRKLLKGCGDR